MIEGFNYGLALQFSVMKNGEHLTSEHVAMDDGVFGSAIEAGLSVSLGTGTPLLVGVSTSGEYIKGLFMNLFVHAYIRFDATRVLAHDALTLANDVGILNPISVI